VHNRYEESNHLLAVASVTANVSVKSSAGIQAGVGNSDNYDGNLVPFSGGFIYEENPTISYKPVTGEAYLLQLTSPIPLSLFSQITQSLPNPDFAYGMLLVSVNGIHNPAFLYDGQEDDPRFDRLVKIMTQLIREHRLHWNSTPDGNGKLSLVIYQGSNHPDANVSELLTLLNLGASAESDEKIVIPVSLAFNGEENGGIGITTRTIWELVEILTAAVEVPTKDETSGAATPFPRVGRAGRDLNIHYTADNPEQAYVAVEHRGGWFYIDERDRATKRYFKLLGNLWSAAMSQSLDDASAMPVLTVPVSR
jgi:hypothetical protein